MPALRWTAPALLLIGLCACTQASASPPPASRQGSLSSIAVPATGSDVAQPAAAATAAASPAPVADRQAVKWLLYNAALKYQINAGLVYAVAWWESGWNQAAVSSTGAIGIMQIEPDMAASGPALLGRGADPRNLDDNIDLGAAILKEDLDRYGNDLVKALVAYNSGPPTVKPWQQLSQQSQAYVLGIYKLAVAFDEDKGPA